jgi:hypothetical protein
MPWVHYEEAMDVLRGWSDREVIVVAFVEPGVSLRPFGGRLSCEDDEHRTLRASVEDAERIVRIAFPAATFHEASWVAGRPDRGLSVVQGATRVDVFLEDG